MHIITPPLHLCVWTCTWRAVSVREYHTYQDIWDAAVEEELLCKREPNNARDSYAVAVTKDDSIVEVLLQYARIKASNKVWLVNTHSH